MDLRRLFQINRNPEFLPVVARLWLIANTFIITWVLLLSEAPGLKKFSACGIVFGIFGSGMLYWETVADEQALQSIRHEMFRSIRSTIMSGEILGFIVLFAHLGFVLFMIYAVLIASELKFGGSGLRAVISLVAIFLVVFSPVFTMVLLSKAIRRWFQRWLAKNQFESREVQSGQVRRLLRYVGFLSLVFSGMMQFPASLL